MLSVSTPTQTPPSGEDSSGSDRGSEVSVGAPATETDRFGFILGNGSTAGSEGPSPELVRQREAKWINIISQWDRVLQKNSSKVKEQCQKGIPASLRAKCWPLLCGATDRMRHNKDLYQTLDSRPALQSWVDVIERDLDRQFPFHEMFLSRDGHGQRGLFRVLKAFTQLKPEEGYCQAQGPVAAVLLMNMPTEAFWCLVQISEQYLPGYYSPLLEGVLFDAAMLTRVLKRTCPAAHKHLQRHGVEPLMFATDWLMCLFTRHLPFNTLLRVWDLFFCYGVRVLFQVAVVLVRRALGRVEQREACEGQMETLERLRGVREQVQQEDDNFIAEVCSVPLSSKDLERQTERELEKWRMERPASTFDPRGRCHGYRMAWARVREREEERNRKEREKGNLSLPLIRSPSLLSLSPSLLRKKWIRGSRTDIGEWEGEGRGVRKVSEEVWEERSEGGNLRRRSEMDGSPVRAPGVPCPATEDRAPVETREPLEHKEPIEQEDRRQKTQLTPDLDREPSQQHQLTSDHSVTSQGQGEEQGGLSQTPVSEQHSDSQTQETDHSKDTMQTQEVLNKQSTASANFITVHIVTETKDEAETSKETETCAAAMTEEETAPHTDLKTYTEEETAPDTDLKTYTEEETAPDTDLKTYTEEETAPDTDLKTYTEEETAPDTDLKTYTEEETAPDTDLKTYTEEETAPDTDLKTYTEEETAPDTDLKTYTEEETAPDTDLKTYTEEETAPDTDLKTYTEEETAPDTDLKTYTEEETAPDTDLKTYTEEETAPDTDLKTYTEEETAPDTDLKTYTEEETAPDTDLKTYTEEETAPDTDLKTYTEEETAPDTDLKTYTEEETAPDTDLKTYTEEETAPDTDLKTYTEEETAPDTDLKTYTEEETAPDTDLKTYTEEETAPDTDLKTYTEEETAPDTDLKTYTEEETAPDTDLKTYTEEETAPDTDLKTYTEEETAPDTDLKTYIEAKTEKERVTETHTDVEIQIRAEAKTEEEMEAEVQKGLHTDKSVETETDMGSKETATQTDVNTDTETDTQQEADVNLEAETDTGSLTERDKGTGTETHTDKEIQARTEIQSHKGTETHTDEKSEAERETALEAHTEPETQEENESAMHIEADTRVEAELGSQIEAETQTDKESEIRVAVYIGIETHTEKATDTNTGTETTMESPHDIQRRTETAKTAVQYTEPSSTIPANQSQVSPELTSTTEPAEERNSSEQKLPEKLQSPVTIRPDQETQKVRESEGEKEKKASTDILPPLHQGESLTGEFPHIPDNPKSQSQSESPPPADSKADSGNSVSTQIDVSSQRTTPCDGPWATPSGDFRLCKSSSSRRLTRRLSEDLFTKPNQSQPTFTQSNQSNIGFIQSNQPQPTSPIQVPKRPESPKRVTGSNPDTVPSQTGPKSDKGPTDTPRLFGLFRRLKGEQPRQDREKGEHKVPIPQILIQDFSDGTGEGSTVRGEEEENLSSRERRRRRREQERREKEEEKLQKKREKELEKERKRERRKPQTRGKSFQVLHSSVPLPGNSGSQTFGSKRNSTPSMETYF
ncbi:mucin-2 isoform X2 [Oncorhynchus nerka]|uniref:mucin-2 isoform X2 n=1 Tax=Oncorhynchus nerka TaxID=8023 RepID=UPI0031B8A045